MKLALITAALYAGIVTASNDRGFHKALSALTHPPEDPELNPYHTYDDFNALFDNDFQLSPHGGGSSDTAYYPNVFVDEPPKHTGPAVPLHHNTPPSSMDYAPVQEYHDVAPASDFEQAVEDFNPWEPIFSQNDYEERIQEEAKVMTSLEALFDIIDYLDSEIEIIEEDIRIATQTIEEHEAIIRNMRRASMIIDLSYEHQAKQVESLQYEARYVENALLEDKAFLTLYCQQFAFSADIVGPCAELLTCDATHLYYKWDLWLHNQ